MTALSTIAVRTVSPHTRRDGRIEIGDRAARQLMGVEALTAELDGHIAPAIVGRFDCRCRDEEPRAYVESPVLMSLGPGIDVRLTFDDTAGRVIAQAMG